MPYGKLMMASIFAPALLLGACNRQPATENGTLRDETANTNAAAANQQQRDEEIAQLDKRVAEIERDYAEAKEEVAADNKTPTAGLREELAEDVNNVKQAVADLRTTTPDNWWTRHEQALRRTADDIEADVARLAGSVKPAAPSNEIDANGEAVSTAPFTSQRDEFAARMRARVDAMEQAIDKLKPRGAQETEVEDVRARINKLGEDVDRLKSASPDDWWDLSKERVTEYVDRIDRSVDRLDDRG